MARVDGLPAMRQALDIAYQLFRADPSFTHFDALQTAMNQYQRAINAWRDTGATAVQEG
jgi:hypothetical protein